ncbi:MAG: hypothetical protein U9R25_09775 [Chloroflexota bacterium]|nr:hypothetical protein [Chloroflexota bacterium]
MKRIKKWTSIAGVGLAVMILAMVALPAAASGVDAAPVDHRGPVAGGPNNHEYLAEALGIPVEALDAAQEAAREAAIQQALDEGLITEAQADVLLERKAASVRVFKDHRGFFGETIDPQALLAEALGISVAELENARDAAAAARLAQAVEDGRITQEQADLMQARQDLREYMDDINFGESMRQAYENALQQAVAAGVITQEQADSILSNGPVMRGFAPKGGHRFDTFRGGGSGDFTPFQRNFRRPARPALPGSLSL